MKVLITGIAGFIGSHLARRLVRRGVEVTGIDDLRWGYADDIPMKAVTAKADIVSLDNADSSFWFPVIGENDRIMNLGDLFRGVDVVIHCAASLEVMWSLDAPGEDLKVNTLGAVRILEVMRRFGIKNLINFSSACVYGRGASDMQACREEDALVTSPHWGYGASKLATEIYCNQYAQVHGFNVFNLRPGIVCGPGEWYGRALTICLKRALFHDPVVVFVDKGHDAQTYLRGDYLDTPKRDFVHVEDVCRMVDCILVDYPREFAGARTFNVGSGVSLSIFEMADKVAQKCGAELVVEEVAEGATSKRVEGRVRIPYEMKGMSLNMDRAKTLGFTPTLNLDDVLEDELEWLIHGGGLKRWQTAEMKV